MNTMRLFLPLLLATVTWVVGPTTVNADEFSWDFYEGQAVKGNGTGVKPNFDQYEHGDLEGFIEYCKALCEEQYDDGCGGFVINFSDAEKTIPSKAVFKKQGSSPYSKETKDTYMVSYYDGPTAFQVVDADGDGTIQKNEARRFFMVMKYFSAGLKEEDFIEGFDEMDTDGDDLVDEEEFLNP